MLISDASATCKVTMEALLLLEQHISSSSSAAPGKVEGMV
jgi:hypothetical protein